MLAEGTTASDFELPGLGAPEEDASGETTRPFKDFRLSEFGDTTPTLLAFYPGDFSPICTEELCSLRDIDLPGLHKMTHIYAISRDSLFTHEAFAYEHELKFPLLSDIDGDVCRAYDAVHEEDDIEGRGVKSGMPKRTVYVLDSEQVVRYAWQTDDPYVAPDFEEVINEIDRLST